jgi:predicted nucleotidyltransferase
MADPWIEKFLQEAVPRIVEKFSIRRLILFGSRIEGTATEDSDIDAIVVSDDFEKIPFLKRSPLLLKTVRFGKHIDFLCYYPEQFERIKKSSSIVADALEHGLAAI